MIPHSGIAPVVTSEELAQLHEVTRQIAKFCRSQLKTYLDGLGPLFRPRRVLGDFIEGAGRETVPSAEQNLAQLKESFFRVCGRPFDLRREFPTPLESVPTQMQLYEWEYIHEVRTERDRKQITVVSPLRWVLAYPSVYSLSMLRQVAIGKQERDTESLRSFALRACLLELLFEKQTGLTALFEGLRYTVKISKSPDLGELPLVTISAPLTTILPPDNLVLNATGLSGRTVFQEILDTEKAARIGDPLQDRVSGILRGQVGEER